MTMTYIITPAWKSGMHWEIKFASWYNFKEKKKEEACVETGFDFDDFIDLITQGYRDGIEMEISVTEFDPTP